MNRLLLPAKIWISCTHIMLSKEARHERVYTYNSIFMKFKRANIYFMMLE